MIRSVSIAIAASLFLLEMACAQEPSRTPAASGPNVVSVTPCGGQRGTTVELTLAGTNIADPLTVWTSFPATVTIPTENDNGKDGKKLRVRLEIPKEVPIGFHALRLATKTGVSNMRLFCIDELPELAQVETNHNKSTPQTVPVPVVVSGRIEKEKSHYYQITARTGERVSFDVIGRRLGSPFDPQISIIDPRTQKELAYSNDSPGLQTDARLTYTFKDAGDYLVEVRDAQWRGGPEYSYRLRIGDFPCATTPLPMAAKQGTRVIVNFAGPNVVGVLPAEVQMPADAEGVWVTPRFANGLAGWPVALAASEFDEVVEFEPNNEPAKANRIPVPVGLTPQFQEKNDIDHFVFTAKKGQRWIMQIQTHELHSPTEVLMTLKDSKGKQVSQSNPQGEPRLDFKVSDDGDYTLSVEHLLYWGGPDESYRLTIAPFAPGFDINLGVDRFDLPPGGHAMLPIQNVVRRDYNGPIEVKIYGPEGLTGQVTIPASGSGGRRAAGADGEEAQADAAEDGMPPFMRRPNNPLFISADAGAAVGTQPIVVEGSATINGKPVVVRANVRSPLSRSMANLPFPPRSLVQYPAVAITEKPPFTLSFKFDAAEYLRGKPAGVMVSAVRAPGFAEEISLAGVALPANVEAELKSIPKDQNEVKAELKPQAKAPVGKFLMTITGKAKHQEKEYTVMAAPAELVLSPPFELKVEPTPLNLALGEKAKLKVTATRKLGYDGPIELELRNLPKNVSAPRATIAKDQTAIELEVTPAAGAALGEKKGVVVRGTATAAEGQQHSSSEFTLA